MNMKRVKWKLWAMAFGLAVILALSGCEGGGGGDGGGEDPGPGPDPGFPDVRGVYTGPGTSTNTNCVNPDHEGTIDIVVQARVPFQDGTMFRMTVDTSSVFGSSNNQVESNVDEAGEWEIMLEDANPPGVAEGTFTDDTLMGSFLFPKTDFNLCNTQFVFTAERP